MDVVFVDVSSSEKYLYSTFQALGLSAKNAIEQSHLSVLKEHIIMRLSHPRDG
ncbi:hypothetical protein [Acinetobacter sp. YH12251]|uniref:hypothetical protein n=1 Tax=Acinetobacter sp. YH12251 TaxID=2601176 RepID=UPI0015D2A7BC|nr:hypothetical protein [Acinetobacter sp. YH12251]